MKTIIKGTNIELTEPLKDYANDKVSALGKYTDDILEARIELEQYSHPHSGPGFRCEVNLHVPQKQVLRAESEEDDLYAAIDTVIPKLKEQIETFKGKRRSQDKRLRRFMKSMFAWRPWRRRK